jgi:hypothetical protein
MKGLTTAVAFVLLFVCQAFAGEHSALARVPAPTPVLKLALGHFPSGLLNLMCTHQDYQWGRLPDDTYPLDWVPSLPP